MIRITNKDKTEEMFSRTYPLTDEAPEIIKNEINKVAEKYGTTPEDVCSAIDEANSRLADDVAKLGRL